MSVDSRRQRVGIQGKFCSWIEVTSTTRVGIRTCVFLILINILTSVIDDKRSEAVKREKDKEYSFQFVVSCSCCCCFVALKMSETGGGGGGAGCGCHWFGTLRSSLGAHFHSTPNPHPLFCSGGGGITNLPMH